MNGTQWMSTEWAISIASRDWVEPMVPPIPTVSGREEESPTEGRVGTTTSDLRDKRRHVVDPDIIVPPAAGMITLRDALALPPPLEGG